MFYDFCSSYFNIFKYFYGNLFSGDNILTALCVARDCGMVEENDKVFLVKVSTKPESESPELYFEPADFSTAGQQGDNTQVVVYFFIFFINVRYLHKPMNQ